MTLFSGVRENFFSLLHWGEIIRGGVTVQDTVYLFVDNPEIRIYRVHIIKILYVDLHIITHDCLGISTTAGRPHTIRLLLISLRSLRSTALYRIYPDKVHQSLPVPPQECCQESSNCPGQRSEGSFMMISISSQNIWFGVRKNQNYL